MPAADVAKLITRRDRAFREIVTLSGPPPSPRPARVDERFAHLVRSITFQLLATKAADTIHARVQQACGGTVTVASVLATGAGDLRGAGLNGVKASAMVELAEAVADGRVRPGAHGRMSDADVAREVTSVRGIGPWTAEMYLMFTLARPDVWPTGDFGVRHGWSLIHDLDEMVTEKELRPLGDPFSGVRSSVAWYCWQAVHESREAH